VPGDPRKLLPNYGIRFRKAQAREEAPQLPMPGVQVAAPGPRRALSVPDPPAAVCETKAGTHSGDGARTDNSAIRARLLGWYNLHPIRDRAKVKRFLPKLYAAYCRRRGWPYACRWMGGYVPAMLVTEHGAPGLGGKRPRHPPPST
jgi:hypothetical protein